MRAFGPGSVSSFIKAVLDVAYALLWAAAALLAVVCAAFLLSLPFSLGRASGPLGDALRLLGRGPEAAGALIGVALYLAALIVVADRLRRVFATLIAGDPFHPDNVRRMRVIGAALAGVEVATFGVRWAAGRLFPSAPRPGLDVNLTAWFAILVVFVLAEVFREGARLRAEAELTV